MAAEAYPLQPQFPLLQDMHRNLHQSWHPQTNEDHLIRGNYAALTLIAIARSCTTQHTLETPSQAESAVYLFGQRELLPPQNLRFNAATTRLVTLRFNHDGA